ncbi:hypothetical protein EON67_10580 [archaeon]|nr:MAG: hypothetical protein EON67_10580 [archaeon]
MPARCSIETSNVETFLNTPAVQKTLGVNLEWTPCNFVVNSMFGNDWMKTFHQLLPPMMADGIDVLIYAGDCDFVCNWLGNQAWTLALDWQGNAGFNGAPFSNWTVNGLPAGQLRTFETLNFLRVFNAGHMVRARVCVLRRAACCSAVPVFTLAGWLADWLHELRGAGPL